MKNEIKNRAIKHGLLFIERGATIRTVAKQTGISKSTVFLDLHRLKHFHIDLFEKVKEKLEYHKKVRHIRGGHTMQKKFNKK